MSSTSPLHSPIPSSANAPKPKGILKNSNERSSSISQPNPDSTSTSTLQQSQFSSSDGINSLPSNNNNNSAINSDGTRRTHDSEGNRLQWDETNLTLNEIDRENTEARMKIDEPKTPFVHGRGLEGDDAMDFDLDGSAPSTPSSGLGLSAGRRSSAAEQLAANTSANALLGRNPSSTSEIGAPAVGLDDASLASNSNAAMDIDGSSVREEEEGPYHPARLRSDSRSPSFSLSGSRRSSSSRSGSSSGRGAGGSNDGRSGVREASRGEDDDEQALDDDDEVRDPETQAKHDEFARKRNMHYGNEAEAMKLAAALAAKEDEEEDEDEDEEGGGGVGSNGIPPVPPLPKVNGA